MSRSPVNRDLFGRPARSAADREPVTLGLRVCAETRAAWLLAPLAGKGAAYWIPKSEVRRGDGGLEHLFTLPRWAAAERGWI